MLADDGPDVGEGVFPFWFRAAGETDFCSARSFTRITGIQREIRITLTTRKQVLEVLEIRDSNYLQVRVLC